MSKVTESIFDGPHNIIPLADVSHIYKVQSLCFERAGKTGLIDAMGKVTWQDAQPVPPNKPIADLLKFKEMHLKMVAEWAGDIGEALGEPSEDFNPDELVALAQRVRKERDDLRKSIAQPVQPPRNETHWSEPTTFIQRFGDAMQALCSGQRPADEMMRAWFDAENDDLRLQHFSSQHGPSWAQGIGVIDAATVMADQPTEGVDHEYRAQPVQPPRSAIEQYDRDHLPGYYEGRKDGRVKGYEVGYRHATERLTQPVQPALEPLITSKETS